jgi:tRNA A-37 threonylcarbamoyl transferase component Bud32
MIPTVSIFGAALIVIVFFFCVIAIPVTGVVVIVYLLVNRSKTKPQPRPGVPAATAPVSPRAAAASPAAAKTQVMPRKCPQCGAALVVDAPEGLCPACLLQRGFATETGASAGQTAFVPPPIPELAELFPQLEILECLGRGGMGAVYKARQPRLDRFVALKILAPEKQNDPQFAERFEREARVLARLSHPHIVSVFDFGETRGRYYLLMEFVDGFTLRQVLQNGKLSPDEAMRLVPQICEALQFAHQQGIVHRDIKPENILLDKQGQLKIADFGIAKIAGVESRGFGLTGVRDVMGTPNYMAPEQVEKPQSVDHRADIYSLGVVFYEMLTGELPLGRFAAPSKKVQVDVRLDEVVLHSLEKEPERRYQQASQIKTAVETIAGSPAPFATTQPTGGNSQGTVNTGIIVAPAVALMVAGLWKILSGVFGTIFLAGFNGGTGVLPGLENLVGPFSSVAIVSVLLFKIVPGALILFGGYQMLQRRSYAWGVAAGILAIVACSLVGLPAGIWALVVLGRNDVKSMFGVDIPSGTPAAQPGWSRRKFVWIAGVIVALGLIALLATVVLVFAAIPEFRSALGNDEVIAGRPVPKDYLTPQQLEQGGIHQEGDEFRKNFSQLCPLEADGLVSVDNVNGSIYIRGWSSNLVAVNAFIHDKSGPSVERVGINIDATPQQVHVHTKLTSDQGNSGWGFLDWLRNFGGERATVDYLIEVPRGAHLEAIGSVNGPIVIDGVAGDIAASTVNGKMKIKGATHDLKLSTVNGQIQAELDLLGARQSVSMDAVNGQIDLGVPTNADASFSVTTVNGSITSEFPELQARREFPVGNNLKGRLGSGSGHVEIRAVNGRIAFLKNATVMSQMTNSFLSIAH